MAKSILIYDGECSFCMRWIGKLKHITRDQVEYLVSKEALKRFPQIPIEDYDLSVQWVDLEGNIFRGAEAVLRALACVPGKKWPLWIYQNIPGFSLVAEWAYRTIAQNRKILGNII